MSDSERYYEDDTEGSARSLRECNERVPYRRNIFNGTYFNLVTMIVPQVFAPARTYERPYYTYFIVMVPTKGRTHSVNIINNIFKRDGYDRICITRESKQIYPHYNVIITTKKVYKPKKNKKGNSFYKRFNITVRKLNHPYEIDTVIKYSFKESMKRIFASPRDFLLYRRGYKNAEKIKKKLQETIRDKEVCKEIP